MGEKSGGSLRQEPPVNLLEECSVVFTPKLGKVDCRCCRRDEPEAMPCAWVRVNGYLNAGRRFEKVSGELVHRIIEPENTTRNPTPHDVEGFDLCAYGISQRSGRSEAVRNCEDIEHRADVAGVKLCRAGVEVRSATTCGYGSDPEAKRRRNSGIVRMQAQRACGREAVESYERNRSVMCYTVCGDELAVHETHVGVKAILSACARV